MCRSLPFLLLAAILLTACGTTTSPTATPSHKPTTTTAKAAPIVGWAREFCSLDSQLSTTQPRAPLQPVGTATDADRQALLDYLNEVIAQMTDARRSFATLSPAPTADANAMLTSYLQNIDEALQNLNGDVPATTTASLGNLELYFTIDQSPLLLWQAQALHIVSTAIKAHPDLRLALTGVPGCSIYTLGG